MNTEEWYDYLNFSKSQKLLIIIILGINVLIKTAPHFLSNTAIQFEYDTQGTAIKAGKQPDMMKIKSMNDTRKGAGHDTTSQIHFATRSKNSSNSSSDRTPEQKRYRLFDFDPNRLPDDSIELLPIPNMAKRNWKKYRSKGGIFRSTESMLKIYGMDSSTFNALRTFIHIHQKKSAFPKTAHTVIKVNSASVKDWQKLKGIGPFYAKNIVQYRSALGGFVQLDQLKEVYRMQDSTFQKILPHLQLDTFHPPFDINEITLQELFRHPYISYKKAKVICQYRKEHGPFNSWSDLSKILILDEHFIHRIKPYFKIQSRQTKINDKGISGL